MRWMTLFALLVGSICLAQEPVARQTVSASSPDQPAGAPERTNITVPAGTRIPVKLTYSLSSKTARVGDTVHVVTVFPVTVDTSVAIPAGTYLEGVIDSVTKRPSHGRPAFQMRFTQLLFANGYTVDVEEATTQARREKPQPQSAGMYLLRDNGKPFWFVEPGVLGKSFAAQQPPPLTPPPNPGPSMGTAIGIGAAASVGAIVAVVLLAHSHNHAGYTFLDEGSPLELVLQKPLLLDATQVAGAITAQ